VAFGDFITIRIDHVESGEHLHRVIMPARGKLLNRYLFSSDYLIIEKVMEQNGNASFTRLSLSILLALKAILHKISLFILIRDKILFRALELLFTTIGHYV